MVLDSDPINAINAANRIEWGCIRACPCGVPQPRGKLGWPVAPLWLNRTRSLDMQCHNLQRPPERSTELLEAFDLPSG